MLHEIKISSKEYNRINSGSQTFLVREDLNDFQTGDLIKMREWNPEPTNEAVPDIPRGYTGSADIIRAIGTIQVAPNQRVAILSLLAVPLVQKSSKKSKV